MKMLKKKKCRHCKCLFIHEPTKYQQADLLQKSGMYYLKYSLGINLDGLSLKIIKRYEIVNIGKEQRIFL